MSKRKQPETKSTTHTSAMEVVCQIKQAFGLTHDNEVLPALSKALSVPLYLMITAKNGNAELLWASQDVDMLTAIEVLQAATMSLTAKQRAAIRAQEEQRDVDNPTSNVNQENPVVDSEQQELNV